MDQNEDQSYDFKIRLLGNEVFAVSLSSTSTSNRWILIALISILTTLTVIGAYGEKFLSLYHSLIN